MAKKTSSLSTADKQITRKTDKPLITKGARKGDSATAAIKQTDTAVCTDLGTP